MSSSSSIPPVNSAPLSPGMPVSAEENPECQQIALVARQAIDELAKLLGGVSNDGHREIIGMMIRNIPKDEQESVVKTVHSLLVGTPEKNVATAIFYMIKTVINIPKSERATALEATEHMTCSPDHAAMIALAGLIPETERMNESALTALLVQCVRNDYKILLALSKIPKAERISVIKAAAPLMEGVTNSNDKVTILNMVALIPRDQRMDMSALAVSLVLNVKDEDHISIYLGLIPETERMSVIVAAAPLMEDVTEGLDRTTILATIGDIPAPERQAKSEALQRLVTGLSLYDKLYCIEEASQLPLEAINQIAQLPVAMRQVAVQEARILFSLAATSYVVAVQRNKIQEDPRAVLHDLVEKFKTGERSTLRVVFLGELGVDASGLSKEFITLLFDSLKSNLHFGVCNNGLYRLTKLQSDEQKLVYRELGQLILFCLNAENYPIGMIFDPGVFAALSKLLQNHDKIDAYKALHCNEDDKNKMSLIQTALEQQTIGVSDEITDNPAQEIHENMQPFIEVAQGIKEAPFTKITWENVRDMSPDEFSTRLQGSFSKELVLNKLVFEESVPEGKRAWIQDWIQDAPDKKVKQFLFALTGSNALGNASLQISNRGENFYFHTCINGVDMPFTIEDKELFISLLESAISDPGNYSRS